MIPLFQHAWVGDFLSAPRRLSGTVVVYAAVHSQFAHRECSIKDFMRKRQNAFNTGNRKHRPSSYKTDRISTYSAMHRHLINTFT